MEFLQPLWDTIAFAVFNALEWFAAGVLARIFPSKEMLDRDAVWAEWNVPPHD